MTTSQQSHPQHGRHLPNMRRSIIATHYCIRPGDTLSSIALYHYGSSAKEKWMAIYQANIETIGPNPNLLPAGHIITIPSLP